MAGDSFRLDQWLWHARFYKSRTLAAAQVAGGWVRVNGRPAARPAHALRPGDVLTLAQGGQVRVVRVLAAGQRRGPAREAQQLYDDIAAGESGAERLE